MKKSQEVNVFLTKKDMSGSRKVTVIDSHAGALNEVISSFRCGVKMEWNGCRIYRAMTFAWFTMLQLREWDILHFITLSNKEELNSTRWSAGIPVHSHTYYFHTMFLVFQILKFKCLLLLLKGRVTVIGHTFGYIGQIFLWC